MKNSLKLLAALGLAALLTGCGDSLNSADPQIPDPATNAEANDAVFRRTCDGIIGLIEKKEYQQAKEALEVFKKFKLTPEQQKVVDRLQADILKAN
jgi:recombinational DNA repair protein (RecF pathway)